VLYLSTCKNKSWTLPSVVTKVSDITCESKPLIFATLKFWSHHRLSTFANERRVQFGQPLHITKGVTSLRVVSLHYDCRLGYPIFNTFPSIILLVWYSSPTMYILCMGLSEFTVLGHPCFADTCYQLLKTKLDTEPLVNLALTVFQTIHLTVFTMPITCSYTCAKGSRVTLTIEVIGLA
jgi:hypothetical protein